MLLNTLLLAGCAGLGVPDHLVDRYSLEYPAPMVGQRTVSEVVKVRRFTVVQDYNTSEMLYGTDVRRNVHAAAQWQSNPCDLVTDALARDLRSAGLFRAVLSYRDNENARYAVNGMVNEFLGVEEKEGALAVLGVTITLVDLTQAKGALRVLFQHDYRQEIPIRKHSPEGLAEGMSIAMKKVSDRIAGDLAAIMSDIVENRTADRGRP